MNASNTDYKIALPSNLLSHHAYLLIGGESVELALIKELESQYHIKVHGNPDFIKRQFENFTIDDARELINAAEMMPVKADGKRIFIIRMNGITIEAQNSLLKLLEEPAAYVHFFLIMPSAHLLIPTVKSRLSIIEGNSGSSVSVHASSRSSGNSELNIIANKFISATEPKRLEMIKQLIDDVNKEKKTKQDVIDFINEIQDTIYRSRGPKDGGQALSTIETARKYLSDRAPSIKMLLEYVALSI